MDVEYNIGHPLPPSYIWNSSDSASVNSSNNLELATEMNDKMKMAVLPVTIFVGIEVIVGFFGNLFVLFVFFFKYHICNFRYFVLCLAIVDFISTITTMPGEIVTQWNWYVYPVPTFCKFKSFFNVFTVSAEALCLFTIAVDRYRKICQPFEKQIKPRLAKILCLFIYLVAAVLALPVAFLWGTNTHMKYYVDIGRYVNVTVCEKDQRFLDTDYPVTYVVIIQSIISLCLFIMLILYIFVAKRLVTRNMNRRQDSGFPMVGSSTEASLPKDPDAQIVNDGKAVSEKDFPSSSESPSKLEDSENYEEVSSNGVNLDVHIETRSDCASENNVDASGMVGGLHQVSSVVSGQHRKKDTMDRVRRKTLIMFILTVIFIVTTVTYLTLLALIAKGVLTTMSYSGKAAYFFFFRLVFINHVINPFVYWWLDTQFRSGIRDMKTSLILACKR